ncbi:hypothetical protein ATANTOWER_001875 [Ataeniobius toweri]|uniref:Uncharacterized protein n=1 Tax=Ataeniobius toweri TaxID=208326 RepID=A0ABU7C5Q1_9TELE|nr:hypothetical protein [Ataeniobius toweri]
MVPSCQFRRPLSSPMRQRPLGQCWVPVHAPALNPGDIPARAQTPQAQPGPQPRGDMPQEPRAHPTPTQEHHGHQASNLCLLAPAKSFACSHQMSPPGATKAPPRCGPQAPPPEIPVTPTQGHPRQPPYQQQCRTG